MSEQPPQPPGSPQPPPSPPPTGGDQGAATSPPGPPPGPPNGPPPSSGGGDPAPPPAPGGGYGAPPPGAGYGAPPPTQGGFEGGYGGAPPAGGQLSQQDERTWGMLAHISALRGIIVGLSFLGPLVVLLVQGPKSPFVRRQAVEALNFQITVYIALIVSAILIIVLIGFFLLVGVFIAWLVLTIMAGVAANRGEDYRYPLTIRMIS